MPRPGGETEEFIGPGRTQPLKIYREIWAVKVFAHRQSWKRMSGERRRFDLDLRNSFAVSCAQPAIFAPDHFLDSRLASQSAPAAIAQRTPTKMDQMSFAGLSFYEVGMPCALQLDVRARSRRQNVHVGMQLIRAIKTARARQGKGVAPASAAFGGQQVIEAITPV